MLSRFSSTYKLSLRSNWYIFWPFFNQSWLKTFGGKTFNNAANKTVYMMLTLYVSDICAAERSTLFHINSVVHSSKTFTVTSFKQENRVESSHWRDLGQKRRGLNKNGEYGRVHDTYVTVNCSKVHTLIGSCGLWFCLFLHMFFIS